MKKEIKGFVVGILVSTIGLTSVFAASKIKSAEFNSNKVIFDGKELDLSSQPMVSIIKEGETTASNYMSVRAVLEQMGYSVDWDGSNNAIIITTKNETTQEATKSTTSIAEETYYKLATDTYNMLISSLKLPSSLTLYDIYAGWGDMFSSGTEVVMFDYSAMNSYGGHTREFLLAWYSIDGDLQYDTKYYKPSDIKQRIILDIDKIVK